MGGEFDVILPDDVNEMKIFVIFVLGVLVMPTQIS